MAIVGSTIRIPADPQKVVYYAILATSASGLVIQVHVDPAEVSADLGLSPGTYDIEITAWLPAVPTPRAWHAVPAGTEGEDYRLVEMASRTGLQIPTADAVSFRKAAVPAPVLSGVSDTVIIEGTEVLLTGENLLPRKHAQVAVQYSGFEITPSALASQFLQLALPFPAGSGQLSVRIDGNRAILAQPVWVVEELEILIPPKFPLSTDSFQMFPNDELVASASFAFRSPESVPVPRPQLSWYATGGEVDARGRVRLSSGSDMVTLRAELGTLETEETDIERIDCPAGSYYVSTLITEPPVVKNGEFVYEPFSWPGGNRSELAIDRFDDLYLFEPIGKRLQKLIVDKSGSNIVKSGQNIVLKPGKNWDDRTCLYVGCDHAPSIVITEQKIFLSYDQLFRFNRNGDLEHEYAINQDHAIEHRTLSIAWHANTLYGTAWGVSEDESLWALDLLTGQLLWRYVANPLYPRDIQVSSDGSIYTSEPHYSRLFKFNAAEPRSGALFRIQTMYAPDFALVGNPESGGAFYFIDATSNEPNVIRRVTKSAGNWVQEVVLGSKTSTASVDGVGSRVTFTQLRKIVADSSGSLFVLDGEYVRKLARCPE